MATAGISVLDSEEARLQCLAILCKISIVRGDLDNAARLLEKLPNYKMHIIITTIGMPMLIRSKLCYGK